MLELNPWIVLLIIWIIIMAIGKSFDVKKRGIEIAPFMIMYKTERLNQFLRKIAKKSPRFWRALWDLGIVVGFFGMGYIFYTLYMNLVAFFTAPANAGAVVPIIPGITVSGMPLVYILIGLTITLLTHELAHGIAAEADDIPVKSSGLVFLLVLIGGFVEPDEEVIKKAPIRKRMRVYGAGSFSNIIFGFLFMIMIMNFPALISLTNQPAAGVYVYNIQQGGPADGVITPGTIIYSLNGTQIETWTDLGMFMQNTTPGSILIINTSNGILQLTLGTNPSNPNIGYIGIYGTTYYPPRPWATWIDPMVPTHLYMTLTWSMIVLISVGMFNLLPLIPLDGDYLLSDLLTKALKEKHIIIKQKEIKAKSIILNSVRLLSLVILALNFIMTFLTGKPLL